MSDNNGWGEWKNLVLNDLEDLKALIGTLTQNVDRKMDDLNDEISDVEKRLLEKIYTQQVQIENLRVKSGVWGLVGGALVAALSIGIKYISG